MRNSPGRFDGKPIGAPSSMSTAPYPLPGPKLFRGIRKRRYFGDPEAVERMRRHVARYHKMKMRPKKIAQRTGLALVEVEAIIRSFTPADLRPRLVKKSSPVTPAE